MKKIQNALLLSCIKVTELLEKKKVIPLNIFENVRLKIHLSMCKACQSYVHQSDAMDEMFEKLGNKLEDNDIEIFQKKLTEKIKE
ncbi:hypothetical protein [Fontibacter flavus]|uniref:Zinc-finger n=1 Tax=Fontibacter flavus TaxID=654838 RepID=A0ABV6FWU5_9BACT